MASGSHESCRGVLFVLLVRDSVTSPTCGRASGLDDCNRTTNSNGYDSPKHSVMEQYHNWSLPASSSDRSAHEPSSCSLASTATSHQQLSSPFLASRAQAPSTSPASQSSSRSNILQVSTHSEAAPNPIATQSWTRLIAFPSSSSLAAWRSTARSATQADGAESSKTHTSSTSTRKQQDVDSFASPSTSQASLHHSTVKMDAGNKKDI